MKHLGHRGARPRAARAETAAQYDDSPLGRRKSREARGPPPHDSLESLLAGAAREGEARATPRHGGPAAIDRQAILAR
jgi:hypothetical protein